MEDLGCQTGYWDTAAGAGGFNHPLNHRLLSSCAARTPRVLDLGCGYGRTLDELYCQGYRDLAGLDPSSRMIAGGREKFPHLDLQVLQGREVPFADGSFDVVLLFAVLTCIPPDGAQQQLLAEVFRLLRPGGILYLSDYPLQQDARNLERYGCFKDKYGCYGVFELLDGAVLRHHSPEWIEELTRRFERIEYLELDVITMKGNRARAFQHLCRKPEIPRGR